MVRHLHWSDRSLQARRGILNQATLSPREFCLGAQSGSCTACLVYKPQHIHHLTRHASIFNAPARCELIDRDRNSSASTDGICEQAAKRTRPIMNTTTLCRACRSIDLVIIFEGNVKECRIPPRSVRAASESNCALCQLVYRSFAKANADYTTDQLLELNLKYTFFPEKLPDEDLPRRLEVTDYWRVRMPTTTFSQRVPRSLDLIGDVFNDHRNLRRLLMKRRLMRKTLI